MRVLITCSMAFLLIAWSPAPYASGAEDLDAAPRGPVNRAEILERLDGDSERDDVDWRSRDAQAEISAENVPMHERDFSDRRGQR